MLVPTARDRRDTDAGQEDRVMCGEDVVVLTTLVPPEGFEPSTSRSGGARSNPLSYEGTGAESSTARATRARLSRSDPPPRAARSRSACVSPPASWVVSSRRTLL